MITTLKHTLKLGLAVASVSLLGSTAQAVILNAGYEADLETMLGAGDLDLTNVYTFATGDAASDFHAAADGMGATLTLMKVLVGGVGDSLVVGGYNPQSWNSSGTYNETIGPLVDRTAFLFNLTDIVKLTQNQFGTGYSGANQTFNNGDYGPFFGVSPDLDSGSGNDFGMIGFAYSFDYGQGMNVFGNTYGDDYTISELEVYTFGPASTGGGNGGGSSSTVPDASSTFGLFGLALLGLAGIRARMKRA